MEQEMHTKRPCDSCTRRDCPEMDCARWQVWFLESWAAVNRYAWAQMDEWGRQEPRGFVYELPHMVKSPCKGCRCSRWCDTPCAARLKWWDARMGMIRRKNTLMGAAGKMGTAGCIGHPVIAGKP